MTTTESIIRAKQTEIRRELHAVLVNEQWDEVARYAKQMAELDAQLAELDQAEPKSGRYSFIPESRTQHSSRLSSSRG